MSKPTDGVVRRFIERIKSGMGVIVIAQGWPCWLPAIWGLRIPVMALYAPTLYRPIFLDGLDELGVEEKDMGCTFCEFQTIAEWPEEWKTHCVLVQGRYCSVGK